MTSPSVILAQLRSYQRVIADIGNGLHGDRFQWGEAERKSYVAKAATLGVTLVTPTQIKKRGLLLKTGAQPVGTAYYGAPLKVYAPLYVLECQCKPKVRKEADRLKLKPPVTGGPA